MKLPTEMEVGRRFARAATNAVIRRPRSWRLFRRLMQLQFDRLAPRWDTIRSAHHLAPLERALDAVNEIPRRALDVGTGTGDGALAIARRFPATEVIGVDLSEPMLTAARDKIEPGLRDRVRFQRADAARLPFDDGSFDLVALANMIPFFDELDRVVAPGGRLLFAFSAGPDTPIWVPPERLRGELAERRFTDFAEFQAGPGTAFLARKPASG